MKASKTFSGEHRAPSTITHQPLSYGIERKRSPPQVLTVPHIEVSDTPVTSKGSFPKTETTEDSEP